MNDDSKKNNGRDPFGNKDPFDADKGWGDDSTEWGDQSGGSSEFQPPTLPGMPPATQGPAVDPPPAPAPPEPPPLPATPPSAPQPQAPPPVMPSATTPAASAAPAVPASITPTAPRVVSPVTARPPVSGPQPPSPIITSIIVGFAFVTVLLFGVAVITLDKKVSSKDNSEKGEKELTRKLIITSPGLKKPDKINLYDEKDFTPTPKKAAGKEPDSVKEKKDELKKPEKPKFPPARHLYDLQIDSNASACTITLRGDGSFSSETHFKLTDPYRLVMDLHGVTSVDFKEVKGKGLWVDRVKAGEHDDKVRLVFDLTFNPTLDFKHGEKDLVIKFTD